MLRGKIQGDRTEKKVKKRAVKKKPKRRAMEGGGTDARCRILSRRENIASLKRLVQREADRFRDKKSLRSIIIEGEKTAGGGGGGVFVGRGVKGNVLRERGGKFKVRIIAADEKRAAKYHWTSGGIRWGGHPVTLKGEIPSGESDLECGKVKAGKDEF